MASMRMFVAVRPPAEQVAELETFLEFTGIAMSGVRLVRADSWHITLSFMPAVLSTHADSLHDALSLLASSTPPFELALRGAGLFPRSGTSTPIWIGVDGELSALENLARRCRTAAQRSGARVDSPKRFSPHVTLSRQPPPTHLELWMERLDQFSGTPWRVDEVEVVETTLGGRGTPARHTLKARHVLTG